MTFNILIATTGRDSLQRMIDSLICQLTENDCLTIVYDGCSTIPIFNFQNASCRINQYFEPEKLGFWGHGIRNKYANLLEKKDFIMHADDDDIYLPNTFNKLRELCIDNETLYIGKFDNKGVLIPRDNTIRINNIGTPCGIIPYNINSKSEWKLQHGGDGMFYENLAILSKNIIHLDICMYKVTSDSNDVLILEQQKRIKFFANKYNK
jgi:hypothetical protein